MACVDWLVRTALISTTQTAYFGLLYGEPEEKNSSIRAIEKSYPVFIGQEFWHHFTGDQDFYGDLIKAIGEIANEFDMRETVEDTINKLAADIIDQYPDLVQ